MQEKQIEKKLGKRIRALGGLYYKFVSPGNAGVPDRLIILPGGRIMFAELKSETGSLTKLQVVQQERMKRLDCEVYTIRGLEGVEKFMREVIENDL